MGKNRGHSGNAPTDGYSPPRPKSSLLSLFSPASTTLESTSEDEPLFALKRSQISKSKAHRPSQRSPTEVRTRSPLGFQETRIGEQREFKNRSKKLKRRKRKRRTQIPNYNNFYMREGNSAIMESDSDYEPPSRRSQSAGLVR